MILSLSVWVFFWMSPQPGGELALKAEIVNWSEKKSPSEVMTTAIPLSDMGQVTDHGHIILSNRDEIFDYTVRGEFVKSIKMPGNQKIRTQIYDTDRHLYTINFWDTDLIQGEVNSFFKFFRANGTAIEQADTQFLVNGEPMVVNQMQYLGEDLFLFNIWGRSFNQEPSPRTLILAKRNFQDGHYHFSPLGERFDNQAGQKRQFQDNFVERWAVFLKNRGSSYCVIAHTMLPELQVYEIEHTSSKTGSPLDVQFEMNSPPLNLNLPNWENQKLYLLDIKRQAEKRGTILPQADLMRAWYYHFSRLKGLYALNDRQVVLGYISPNAFHRFFDDSESQTDESLGATTHLLHLVPFNVEPNDSSIAFLPSAEPMVIEGGILLGTYKQNTYVLREEDLSSKNLEPNFVYTLHKISF